MNQQLIENNFLYVPNFISCNEADSLAQQFFIAQKNNLLVHDDQCPESLAIYNFLPCVKLLIKKIPEVSNLVESDVLPTYVYGRIYYPKQKLLRHRDRNACEISVTLNLEQRGESWPIWVQKPNGDEISLDLKPGDAMIYKGCEADHWRDEFKGESYVQVFLHYVLADGQRAYAVFDRNK